MENLIKIYNTYIEKNNAYQVLLALASFDNETVGPQKGVIDRGNAMSFVAGELFEYNTNPVLMDNLKKLYEIDEDETRKHVLKYVLEQYEKTKNIPQSLVIRESNAITAANLAWKKARENSDYSLFEKAFNTLLDIKKEMVGYMPSKGSAYNTLLNEFEPGMTVERYDLFFNTIKERLVPFIQKINTAKMIDDQRLFEKYDIEKQKQVMEVLKTLFKYDPNLIYLGESAHPFSSTITLNDGRITVRYLENSLTSAIYSFIHEYGHALYGVQVHQKFAGTPIIHAMSMGMHESQSRLMENHIGRNPVFVKKLFEKLVDIFPEQLKDITVEQFYEMSNVARCSLIRVEADELTYPLHILVRYEVEKAIFDGNIAYDEIKPLWNKLYKDYLGLDVNNDAEGILQDVHFSYGTYGYFPTYALGSAFAAQFYEALDKAVDVDKVLENNTFEEIQNWLKDNIHQYSATIPSYELLEKVTGKTFDPNIYVDYLIQKFSRIYNIECY